MLILNMAMNIHVTVRYLQLKNEYLSYQKVMLYWKLVKNDILILYTC